MLGINTIRPLHIFHNAPYLPPKFCITFVFHFCWVLQPSQEKMKTVILQNLGVQNLQNLMCIMGDVQVAYRIFSSKNLHENGV